MPTPALDSPPSPTVASHDHIQRLASHVIQDEAIAFECEAFIASHESDGKLLRLRILPTSLWPTDVKVGLFHPTMIVSDVEDGVCPY